MAADVAVAELVVSPSSFRYSIGHRVRLRFAPVPIDVIVIFRVSGTRRSAVRVAFACGAKAQVTSVSLVHFATFSNSAEAATKLIIRSRWFFTRPMTA